MWESPELRAARELGPEDFERFGIPEDQLRELFLDDSAEAVRMRHRLHQLGSSFQPIIEFGLAVPPEYDRLFGEGGPLNAPLPMTGRTIVESAVVSADEFAYAADYLGDVAADLGSWLDA